MAHSGVSIQDNVVEEFNAMKLRHKYDLLLLKISGDLKSVEIEKTVETCSFAQFLDTLPVHDCRFAVYDFHFDVGEAGNREQLIFVLWCPETAPIKSRMMFASTKDALRKKLVGINHEFQATDRSELQETEIVEKLRKKMVK